MVSEYLEAVTGYSREMGIIHLNRTANSCVQVHSTEDHRSALNTDMMCLLTWMGEGFFYIVVHELYGPSSTHIHTLSRCDGGQKKIRYISCMNYFVLSISNLKGLYS